MVEPRTAPVVRANSGVEAWYRNQLHDFLEAMYASMSLHLRVAFDKGVPTVGLAQDASSRSILLDKALKKWGKLWQKKLDDMSAQLSRSFALRNASATQTAMRDSFARVGFTVKFKSTKGSLDAYHSTIAENVNLISSLGQKFNTDIASSVWQSVNRGADMATLSTSLQKVYGVSYRRAALIARDQNHKAKALLENTRRMELGITEARWQHSTAGKEPRPEHVAFSGKTYQLAKGAYLEKKWVWPGSEINCRCTSKAIIPGFK